MSFSRREELEREALNQLPRSHPAYKQMKKLWEIKNVPSNRIKFIQDMSQGWLNLLEATEIIENINGRLEGVIGRKISDLSFQELLEVEEKYLESKDQNGVKKFCVLILSAVSLSDSRLPAYGFYIQHINMNAADIYSNFDSMGNTISPDQFDNQGIKIHMRNDIGLKGIIFLLAEAYKRTMVKDSETARILCDQCEYLMLKNTFNKNEEEETVDPKWSFQEPYGKQYLPFKSKDEILFVLATIGWKNVRTMLRTKQYFNVGGPSLPIPSHVLEHLFKRQCDYAAMQVKAKPNHPTGHVNLGHCAYDRYRYTGYKGIKQPKYFDEMVECFFKAMPIADAAENALLSAVCRLSIAGGLISGAHDCIPYSTRLYDLPSAPKGKFFYCKVRDLVDDAKDLMKKLDKIGYKEYACGESTTDNYVWELEKRMKYMDEKNREIFRLDGKDMNDGTAANAMLKCFGLPDVTSEEGIIHKTHTQALKACKKMGNMSDIVQGCAVPSCQKAGVYRCARCKVIKYCSAECQKKHWKLHKKACVVKKKKGQKGKREKKKKMKKEEFKPNHPLESEAVD